MKMDLKKLQIDSFIGEEKISRKQFNDCEFSFGNPNENSILFQITKLDTSPNIFQIILRLIIVAVTIWLMTYAGRIPSVILRFSTNLSLFLLGTYVLNKVVFDGIKRESILIIRDKGLQIFKETVGGDIVDVLFFEKSQINQVLINEGFTIYRVVVFIVIELTMARKHEDLDTKNGAASSAAAGFHNRKLGPLVMPFAHIRCPIWLNVQVASAIREYLGMSNLKS